MPWNTVFTRSTLPEAEELNTAYRRTFTTPEGRMVLNDLCTSLKLVQFPHKEGASMVDARAFHDGQRAVALKILQKLEETTNG